MFGIVNFGAFVIAGILLNMTPGADTVYILSRSIASGKKAGILSALGISTGSLIHTLLAALGLSILLAESQTAFNLVKYLGAAYLIYLGLKMILTGNKNNFVVRQPVDNSKDGKIYISGMVTNLLNPKVALFYLAFLPHFIDPSYPYHYLSFIILGITFTATGTIWCLMLAIFAANISRRISSNKGVKLWLEKVAGMVFISLGLKVATSKFD